MFAHCRNRYLLLAATICAPACWGQTNAPATPETTSTIALENPPPRLLNRIGLSYRIGANISVDFRKLGGLQLSDPGSATGSAVNRNYDDGYNRVDTSGNAGGRTWYWGYSSAQSVQGDNLALQSDSTPSTAHSGQYQDEPQSGVELTYSRELTRGDHWRFGLEGAFGYSALSFRDSQTLSYFVNRTSDSYTLNGVIPPEPPYNGTFQGPAAVIPSLPTDRSVTVLPGAATILGERRLDADLFTIRLGPYLEIPLGGKFAVTVDGGLTLAVADTEFKYRETVLISDPFYGINLASSIRSDSGSETDFLVGGYAGANLSYAVSERVRILGGVIFQAAGRAYNNQGDKQSVLDLGKSVLFSVGATYAF